MSEAKTDITANLSTTIDSLVSEIKKGDGEKEKEKELRSSLAKVLVDVKKAKTITLAAAAAKTYLETLIPAEVPDSSAATVPSTETPKVEPATAALEALNKKYFQPPTTTSAASSPSSTST
ncbi:MAG: hypothetical protein Q8O95_05100 [bacterium]|nr:hypothetical protein [bacterium]